MGQVWFNNGLALGSTVEGSGSKVSSVYPNEGESTGKGFRK